MLKVAAVLAYRQLTHRGPKLVGALSGVCVAITLMFIQLGFQNALYDSAANVPNALNADILLVSPQFVSMAFTPPWFSRAVLVEAEGAQGVASTTPFYAQTIQVTSPRNGETGLAWLLAAEPHGAAFTSPVIAQYAQVIAQPNSVILDDRSRHEFQWMANSVRNSGATTVTLPMGSANLQQTIDIKGLFSIGPTFTVDGVLITSELNFYRIIQTPLDRISLGLVKLKAGTSSQDMSIRLKNLLGNRVKIFTKEEFVQGERDYYASNTPIGYIFRAGLFVGVVVGLVFISQALHGIISDNIREYAVLRAMGYKDEFFLLQIGIMSLGIAVVTYIPSALMSFGFYRLASSATSLPLEMKIVDMLIVFGVVIGMGMLATIMARRKLQKANPVDLFS